MASGSLASFVPMPQSLSELSSDSLRRLQDLQSSSSLLAPSSPPFSLTHLQGQDPAPTAAPTAAVVPAQAGAQAGAQQQTQRKVISQQQAKGAANGIKDENPLKSAEDAIQAAKTAWTAKEKEYDTKMESYQSRANELQGKFESTFKELGETTKELDKERELLFQERKKVTDEKEDSQAQLVKAEQSAKAREDDAKREFDVNISQEKEKNRQAVKTVEDTARAQKSNDDKVIQELKTELNQVKAHKESEAKSATDELKIATDLANTKMDNMEKSAQQQLNTLMDKHEEELRVAKEKTDQTVKDFEETRMQTQKQIKDLKDQISGAASRREESKQQEALVIKTSEARLNSIEQSNNKNMAESVKEIGGGSQQATQQSTAVSAESILPEPTTAPTWVASKLAKL